MLNQILQRIRSGKKRSSETYLSYLRAKGVRIGEGTALFNPETILIDDTSPHMITIGKNVQITGGVTILSHDYGWSVLKSVYGEVLGSIRPVRIGDNVYIGMNAIILAGASIGSNVIVGANSVVTKDIPDNCVAIGSPCKPLYSLEEYYNRRKNAQLEEAVQFVKEYYECYGIVPEQDALGEHFWLFTNDKTAMPDRFVSQNNLMPGSEELTWKNFAMHQPQFKNYEEFISYAMKSIHLEKE